MSLPSNLHGVTDGWLPYKANIQTELHACFKYWLQVADILIVKFKESEEKKSHKFADWFHARSCVKGSATDCHLHGQTCCHNASCCKLRTYNWQLSMISKRVIHLNVFIFLLLLLFVHIFWRRRHRCMCNIYENCVAALSAALAVEHLKCHACIITGVHYGNTCDYKVCNLYACGI